MRRFTALILFLLIAASSFSEHSPAGAYLVPRHVYVGDTASLVLPLPGLTAGETVSIVLTPGSPDFPSHPYIDFHRVTLERRGTGSVLIVEFAAFQTGRLELPSIKIGGEYFPGLTAEIRSILARRGAVLELSNPALPLTMPGTALLVYGTIAAAVLVLFSVLLLLLRGRGYVSKWLAAWKRKRKLAAMKAAGRRLHKALLKNGKCRDILDALSLEFRAFLSFFFGENCRAMTASELENNLSNDFLGSFFRRCDELRFRGGAADKNDVLAMLADLRAFLETLETLEKTEREQKQEEAA